MTLFMKIAKPKDRLKKRYPALVHMLFSGFKSHTGGQVMNRELYN